MKDYQFNKLINNLKEEEILGKEKLKQFGILITIALIDGEYQFVFQKRAKHIRQGGEVSFPGGAFDSTLDKNLKDTAIRETVEEFGIERDKIDFIKAFDIIPSYVYIETFIAMLKIESLDELNICKDEVEYAFSLPIDYFIKTAPHEHFVKVRSISSEYIDDVFNEYLPIDDLMLPDYYKNSWDNGIREIYTFPSEHGPIWGLTARIIISLLKDNTLL